MTNEEMSLELMGGNRQLRNSLIMQNMGLIRTAIKGVGFGGKDDVQSAVEYLAKRLHYYDGSGSMSNYIYNTAKGGASMMYRRVRPRAVDWKMIEHKKYPSPSNVLERKEYRETRNKAIVETLLTLDEYDAQLLIDSYLTRKSEKLIAWRLGVTQQCINIQKHKALKKALRVVEKYRDDLR